MKEKFISGHETLMTRYDQIYPLDDPKYITPQQKDFQIVLSEHSALDPNMQNRRKDITTQMCRLGDHCFDTQESHELRDKFKSSPDVINSKVGYETQALPNALYERPQSNKVVPHNSVSRETRADLFDDIVLPELFFRRKSTIST